MRVLENEVFEKREADILDHPDKYVQQDVLQDLDREALQLKSTGDLFYLKNDIEKALEAYQKSLKIVTAGNSVLRRELVETIPICLARLKRINESVDFFTVRRLQ